MICEVDIVDGLISEIQKRIMEKHKEIIIEETKLRQLKLEIENLKVYRQMVIDQVNSTR
jgi:hypothetical protein